MRKKQVTLRPRILIAFALLGMLVLAACSPLAKLVTPFSGFDNAAGQPKVHFTPGAESLANEVAAFYPAAVVRIEQSHGTALGETPDVYICASPACYRKYAFIPMARGETRPSGEVVMLNGFELAQDGSAKAILTHELSHAYWFTRGVRCLPRWWEEGLAVYVSGGGGAEKVSLAAATSAIRAHHVFQPSLESGCFFANSAARYGLVWPMYYRQSGMFVEFLDASNHTAFSTALRLLRDKVDLSDAIAKAYGQSIDVLWSSWLNSVTQQS